MCDNRKRKTRCLFTAQPNKKGGRDENRIIKKIISILILEILNELFIVDFKAIIIANKTINLLMNMNISKFFSGGSLILYI